MRSDGLDDPGRLRRYRVIFVDGEQVSDRIRLTNAVDAGSEVLIMQALSGG